MGVAPAAHRVGGEQVVGERRRAHLAGGIGALVEPSQRLLDAIDAELDGVEQALARLDEGSYATCEVCSAPLADEWLAADPVGRRCDRHRAP